MLGERCGRPWGGPTLLCVGGLPRRERPTKKPLSNHRRPAGWKTRHKAYSWGYMTQTIGETHHDHSGEAYRHGTSSFLSAPCFLYIWPWPTPCSHEPFQTRDSVGCVVHCSEIPDTAARARTSVSEAVDVFIKKDLRVMAQNTSHEPRNSVCKVLSQEPSEMCDRL